MYWTLYPQAWLMSNNRPQRATGKADANHFIPRDFLRDRCGGFITAPKKDDDGKTVTSSANGYTANYRGYPVAAIDISHYGGLLTDWIISVDGIMIFVEIKTPEAYQKENNSLTPGEKWTLRHIGLYVIFDESGFEEMLDSFIR